MRLEHDGLRVTDCMMRLVSSVLRKPKMLEVVDHLNEIASSGIGDGVIRSADSKCSDRDLYCQHIFWSRKRSGPDTGCGIVLTCSLGSALQQAIKPIVAAGTATVAAFPQ